MSKIAALWDFTYKAGAQEMYRVNNPKRFIRLTRRLPVAHIVKRGLIRAGGSVLEVGCGGAQYGIAFALCGYRTTVLDYSVETLRIAQCNAVTAKEVQPGIEVKGVQGDIFNLPLLSRSFDLVFNEGALEHFALHSERVQCIAEMLRVTKPDGYIMIMIPNNVHPLVTYWTRHDFPWLRPSNPLREYVITPEMLSEEMMTAGCKSVYLDGYEVYDSIQKWPRSIVRTVFARGLKCLFPEPPRRLRMRYGTYLFGIGMR